MRRAKAKMTALPSPSPNPLPASREREQWAALGRVLLGILARWQAQGQSETETVTEPKRNAPEA